MSALSIRPLGRPQIDPIHFDHDRRTIGRLYEVLTDPPNANLELAGALVTLSGVDPEFSGAYLVEQGLMPASAQTKDVRLRRVYSEIPKKLVETRRVSYTYPAITAAGVTVVRSNITAIDTSTRTLTIPGHTFDVDDTVVYRLNYVVVITGGSAGAAFFNYNGVAVVTAVDGDDVTLNHLNAAATISGPGYTVQSLGGYAFLAGLWRESQLTEIVNARVTTDFYLPGVSSDPTGGLIANVADIEKLVYERFRIYGVNGEILNATGAGTSPTSAEYQALVANKELIVAESYVERWKGNIHALITVEVPAR